MKRLKLTGLLCTYLGDDAQLLEACLASILGQTRALDELVVVFDGPVSEESYNSVMRVINSLEGIGVLVKHHMFPANVGHGLARSKGVELATGDYVVIFDADDISSKDRLKLLEEEAKRGNYDVIGGHIREFSSLRGSLFGYRVVKLSHDEIYQDMFLRCPFNQTTVMIKKVALDNVGGYRDMFCNEDYELWLRLAAAGHRFANVDVSLVDVVAPTEYFSRRGGWRYCQSELKMQWLLFLHGKSLALFLRGVLVRLIVYLFVPTGVRRMLYRKFLRDKEWIK